jgi:hypothetical protein
MAMWQWKLHLKSFQAFAVTGTLEANVPVVTKEEFFRLDPEHPFDHIPDETICEFTRRSASYRPFFAGSVPLHVECHESNSCVEGFAGILDVKAHQSQHSSNTVLAKVCHQDSAPGCQ